MNTLKKKEIVETPKIENMNSEQAYWYCLDVEDTKEVRDKITNSYWAYWYCRNIKNRKEVRDRIFNNKWKFESGKLIFSEGRAVL